MVRITSIVLAAAALAVGIALVPADASAKGGGGFGGSRASTVSVPRVTPVGRVQALPPIQTVGVKQRIKRDLGLRVICIRSPIYDKFLGVVADRRCILR
jgi:hypothetical protein